MDTDNSIQKVLEWSANNEVDLRITKEGGHVVVTAEREFISAQYPVDKPYDASTLGLAAWSALNAVKHGAEFHEGFRYPTPSGDGDFTDTEENSGV